MEEPKERLKRRNDWYLKGWELETVPGKRRKQWIYRGEYYAFPASTPLLRLRVTLGVSLAVLLVSYFVMTLCPAVGNSRPLVSYSGFLGIIPLLYFSMGSFWTVVTSGAMTLRRYHSGVRRMRTWAPVGAAVTAVTSLAQLAVLFSGGTNCFDWVLLFASVSCLGQYLLCLNLLKKNPVTVAANS